VYKELWSAGQDMKIANVGYRAIDSLRMEKGYLYWSGDISPDYTPLEAGLGFRVHFDAKNNFLGRQALEIQKKNGVDRKLFTFVSEHFLPLTGGETILESDQVVSLATSVAYGFTVKKTIIRGYLDRPLWAKTEFILEVFGKQYRIKKVTSPIYDPNNIALKS
jgi:4-methylaminobutanoate oxidase (formaldehyde-forming)